MSAHRRYGSLAVAVVLGLGGLLTPMASAKSADRALEVVGQGGSQTTLLLKTATTITDIQWTNWKPSSADAGLAIRSGSALAIAAYWLPSLRHGPELVRTALLPVKLAAGRYSLTLLGSGQLSMRLLWSAANLRLKTQSKATLKATAKTDYGTAPFNRRWLVDVPTHAWVMEGYIVYGTADLTEVNYCFHPGQNSCLTPLAGYTGVQNAGGWMYYLTYQPGQLTPGTYEFGELAVSDSPSMQAGGFVVSLA